MMETAAPIIAVVGTGSIGSRHMNVLSHLGATVIAVPQRPERRNELEREGLVCAGSLCEARDAFGVEAAIICTDTSRHVANVMEALSCGLHVLCEKPLAPSCHATKGLQEAMRAAGRAVFVACNLRFDLGLKIFRNHLADAGELHSIRIECRSYLPEWRPHQPYKDSYSARVGEGGVLLDLVHELDYALWFFGQPSHVNGVLINHGLLDIPVDETAAGSWRAPNGALISMELDYVSRVKSRFVRATGTKGEIIYNIVARTLNLVRPGQAMMTKQIPGNTGDAYQAQALAFLEFLSGGSPGELATIEAGMNVLAVCDAWRRSSLTGCAEKVSL